MKWNSTLDEQSWMTLTLSIRKAVSGANIPSCSSKRIGVDLSAVNSCPSSIQIEPCIALPCIQNRQDMLYWYLCYFLSSSFLWQQADDSQVLLFCALNKSFREWCACSFSNGGNNLSRHLPMPIFGTFGRQWSVTRQQQRQPLWSPGQFAFHAQLQAQFDQRSTHDQLLEYQSQW